MLGEGLQCVLLFVCSMGLTCPGLIGLPPNHQPSRAYAGLHWGRSPAQKKKAVTSNSHPNSVPSFRSMLDLQRGLFESIPGGARENSLLAAAPDMGESTTHKIKQSMQGHSYFGLGAVLGDWQTLPLQNRCNSWML